ncbi:MULTISPECIES: hypothetical protein [unclassified Pseudomonas]|uniref:hypothetical protein n=1 Tax=unclassified Pseudomonas TaxID=196821 RepID=UPI00117A4545|nr:MULTISPECIES: hypothetical protein [unclassified Pseudomonas]
MKNIKSIPKAGNCSGTVGADKPFNAQLVELTSKVFPPPFGSTLVMLARHREPHPSYKTKEIHISFGRSLANDEYIVTPESNQVRITFVDNTVSTEPLIYSQKSGVATLAFDNEEGIFSGKLTNVVLLNQDEEDAELLVNLDFSAHGDVYSAGFKKNLKVA